MKQRIHRYPGQITAVLMTLLWLAASSASASTEVFTWTDENGIVHFSDAPPGDGEASKINVEGAYKPGTSGAYPADADKVEESVDASGENMPGDDGVESASSAAQQRRAQMAKDREERRKAQDQIDQLCGLNRERLEKMEPARRVFYIDEQGQEVRMNDDQRVSLINESKAFIAKNCE